MVCKATSRIDMSLLYVTCTSENVKLYCTVPVEPAAKLCIESRAQDAMLGFSLIVIAVSVFGLLVWV